MNKTFTKPLLSIQGRPYPLKGRYYANIFVHFEPLGHCLRHSDRMQGKDVVVDDAKALYEKAMEKATAELKSKKLDFKNKKEDSWKEKIQKQTVSNMDDKTKEHEEKEIDTRTPYYIESGSFEEKRWNQKLEYEYDSVCKTCILAPFFL